MKKTLIAMAALAAIGSASAQVTLYGKVDLGASSTTTTGSKDQGLEVTSGNYESSRLGVKGGSDLGSGVKAIFQYEMGVNAANYASAITTDRVAMVGVTGSFGTVGLGLQWTPYDSAWGWDQTEYNGFSAPNKTWYKGVHGDNGSTGMGNAKKAISYTTPNMNGFDATIMFANNADAKDATAATVSCTNDTPANPGSGLPVTQTCKAVAAVAAQEATKYIGIGANYAAGALNLNFGYESVPSSAHNSGAAQADKTSAYVVGASYDLGVAKIGTAFEQANVDLNGGQAKDTGYTFGVSLPLNKQTTLAASYASETTTSAVNGQTDGTSKGFGGQVIYALTAQAAMYAGAFQVKATPVASNVETTTTKYAAGLRYNF